MAVQGLSATLRPDADKLFVEYEALALGSGYTRPAVMLEFGARSTGEPWEVRQVTCDAAPHLAGVEFPVANPQVMLPERTFWEKATAIHVFCAQGEFRGGERFARHWHDVLRLDRAGFAELAIRNRGLADSVARHKAAFFAEKDPTGVIIDYSTAITGGLRLVPSDAARGKLANDYARMIDDGLLAADAESFDELMERCGRLEMLANRAGSGLASPRSY